MSKKKLMSLQVITYYYIQKALQFVKTELRKKVTASPSAISEMHLHTTGERIQELQPFSFPSISLVF